MPQNKSIYLILTIVKTCIYLLFFLNTTYLHAQTIEDSVTSPNEKSKPSFFTGEWYFSWGYNKDYWSPSDIHVTQGALNNDFTVHNVQADDYPQWEDGVYNHSITEPQYSFRIGHFINPEKNLALELNYDHTKFSSVIDQTSLVTGTISNQPVNMNQHLTSSYFRYNLHNGANHIMLNIVKRVPLLRQTNETFSLALMGKAGAGIMLPHSDNTILGRDNDVGPKQWGNYLGVTNGWWQVNGWTIGIEAGFRFVIYKPIFIEFTDKEAYASLINIPVYQGTASQQVWMNELILTVGFTLNG